MMRSGETDCRARLVEISRYLEGDLTAARCRIIERHLESCSCCAKMATRVRRTIAACRKAGGARLPHDVRLRAQARIRAILDGGDPSR
jgi:anti-sigma factor RsiW